MFNATRDLILISTENIAGYIYIFIQNLPAKSNLYPELAATKYG